MCTPGGTVGSTHGNGLAVISASSRGSVCPGATVIADGVYPSICVTRTWKPSRAPEVGGIGEICVGKIDCTAGRELYGSE